MLFNTPVFLVFLIVVVTTFYFLPKKIDKVFLLAASYVFYGYWDWRFLLLLIGSSLMDYYLGYLIYKMDTRQKKRLMVCLSLVLNLGILCFFKYFNFFIDSFHTAFGTDLDFLHVNVILPIGISFYTFQSLSYTIDIYREKLKPTNSVLDYCLFIGVFPHMQSGPIVRAMDMLPQLKVLDKPTKHDFYTGFSLITIGMFQKVLIGDTASKYVDHIFSEPTFYNSDELLFSLFMFSVQIYADFAGYSNIARGSAKLFGIDLIDNFNQPFFSKSLTEFWRRWHISLSTWFNDYLYYPIVLNLRNLGKLAVVIGLIVTFFVSGLWHGAGWTFIFWGILQAVGLIYEFYTKKKRKKIFGLLPQWLNDMLSRTTTYLYAVFTWLFFRSPDFTTARLYLDKLFVNWKSGDLTADLSVIFITYLLTLLLIDKIEIKYGTHEFLAKMKPPIRYGIALPLWVGVILYMYTVGTPTPFIYFQF